MSTQSPANTQSPRPPNTQSPNYCRAHISSQTRTADAKGEWISKTVVFPPLLFQKHSFRITSHGVISSYNWLLVHYAIKNISQAKGGGNSGEDLEDNSLLLVIPLLVIQCGVVSYSCLPNSPLSSPPWLDLDAACIHHCIA